MGLIFSLLRRSKTSTRDTLEKIEQELQNIEERRWDSLKREKLIVQLLSFLSITFVIVTLFVIVFPRSSSWQEKSWIVLPMAMLSFGCWQCKKLIQWYSSWSRENEEARLRKLRKEKKKILENVCETESYKVASELLDRYDPKHLRRRNVPDHQLHPTLLEHSMSSHLSNINSSLNKSTISPVKTTTSSNRLSLAPQLNTSQIKQDLMKSLLNQSINLMQTSNGNTSLLQLQQQHQASTKVSSKLTASSNDKFDKSEVKNKDIEEKKSSDSSPSPKSLTSETTNADQSDTESAVTPSEDKGSSTKATATCSTTSGPGSTSTITTMAKGSSKTAVTNSNLNSSLAVGSKQNTVIAASSVQGRPVRPILSRDRSLFEKMIDWVVTDGPDNRFALICKSCYGHNGMCLEEEFPRLNFRCCYCYNLNLAESIRTSEANST